MVKRRIEEDRMREERHLVGRKRAKEQSGEEQVRGEV